LQLARQRSLRSDHAVALAFILLLVTCRSIVVPIKAIILNLLTQSQT
jgi:hypothetical protein